MRGWEQQPQAREGIPRGLLSSALASHLSSLGDWEGGEVAAGGVTARVLLLTQAGRGAGLAVVTPGPLSPRFSQALSFLGGEKGEQEQV